MKIISLTIIGAAFIQLYLLSSCNSGESFHNSSFATDSITITKGERLFVEKCSGCHNFSQDGIGPALGEKASTVSGQPRGDRPTARHSVPEDNHLRVPTWTVWA